MATIQVDAPQEKRRCFVITPIGSDHSDERRHANMVFETALRPTLEARGYSLERSDLANDPGQITAAIFSAIFEADLCIADLSFLNPNVMYELGVRHALNKQVIQIAVAGTRLPFDTANQRTLFFDVGDIHSLRTLADDISKQMDWLEANPDTASNPLTAALGLFENAAKADPQSKLINDLASRIQALETNREEGASNISAGIIGQGELATKNTRDLRRIWRADQTAQALDWVQSEDGSETAEYRGFVLNIHPQSKGRWSGHAAETGTEYSVPWPVWQSSAHDAKSIIVRAVDEALSEREA